MLHRFPWPSVASGGGEDPLCFPGLSAPAHEMDPWTALESIRPSEVPFWEVLEGRPVPRGPCSPAASVATDTFMWLRHGLCQEVVAGRDGRCVLLHRCRAAADPEFTHWLCPICDKLLFMPTRVFDDHFRACSGEWLGSRSSSPTENSADQDFTPLRGDWRRGSRVAQHHTGPCSGASLP